MQFESVLEQNAAPRRVGDVRLRFEDQLLIGETGRALGLAAAGLFIGALGAAACALALLLPTSGARTVGPSIFFGVAAAGLVAASIYAEQRARARRRFVLNFEAERLRLDAPTRLLGRPRTCTVPFDAVRDIAIVPRGARFGLEAQVEQAPGESQPFLLVDHVPGAEVEVLRRLWRMLRAAVGLQLPLS